MQKEIRISKINKKQIDKPRFFKFYESDDIKLKKSIESDFFSFESENNLKHTFVSLFDIKVLFDNIAECYFNTQEHIEKADIKNEIIEHNLNYALSNIYEQLLYIDNAYDTLKYKD